MRDETAKRGMFNIIDNQTGFKIDFIIRKDTRYFKLAFDLTELSRFIISNSIRKKEPGITDIELKIKLFKTFCRFDFDQEKLDEIARQMRQFLTRDKNYTAQ